MILILAAVLWLGAFAITWARRRTNAAWRDALAIGGIGAATAGFFWRLLAGQVWMPAGGGDLAQFLYPTYAFAAEWWRRGVIPLWNPHLFGGMPFVGDIQSGIFYPLNLFTFFLSAPLTFRDLELLAVLHHFIAGAGMYAFLRFGKWRAEGKSQKSKVKSQKSEAKSRESGIGNRKLEVGNWKLEIGNWESGIGNRIWANRSSLQSPLAPRPSPLAIPAALAGALAFEFSDLFITHFGNLNLIAAFAWLPLVLLFYRRAVTDRRASFAVIAGGTLALAFLAGHIQTFLFILIALGLLALFHFARAFPATNFKFQILNFEFGVAPLLLTGLIAFGFAAPALLPALEFAQHTVRASFAYEQAAQYSLPPAQLIGLLVPGFFGRGPQNAWGPWARVEVGYLGVLPLVLAALALVLRRDATTRFFGAFALIGLALALGGYAILHGWLYQFAPGFGQLRAPARFIGLMDFALATLAAFGFDTLLRALPRASTRAFKWIVRAAPWMFLLIAIPTGVAAGAILILGQGQDAVLFARIANATNALAFFILLLALALALVVARATRFFRRAAWATLALVLIGFDLFALGAYVDSSLDDPTRVFEHPDAGAFLQSAGGVFRVDSQGTGVEGAWNADTAILYGLHDLNGDNPLVLADWDRYWQNLGSRSSRLYDLLNVKFLIGRKNVPLDREKFRLAYDGDPALHIFENTRALPRAFVVFDARNVPDQRAAFEAIHAPDFDPAKTVVLENAPRDWQATPAAAPVEAQIVGYGPNDIRLEIATPRAGMLVLSEVDYPGWRAWVDERETPVLRANYLLRAVQVPADAQRVRLRYEPRTLQIGAALFVLTLIGVFGGAVRASRIKRERGVSATPE